MKVLNILKMILLLSISSYLTTACSNSQTCGFGIPANSVYGFNNATPCPFPNISSTVPSSENYLSMTDNDFVNGWYFSVDFQQNPSNSNWVSFNCKKENKFNATTQQVDNDMALLSPTDFQIEMPKNDTAMMAIEIILQAPSNYTAGATLCQCPTGATLRAYSHYLNNIPSIVFAPTQIFINNGSVPSFGNQMDHTLAAVIHFIGCKETIPF